MALANHRVRVFPGLVDLENFIRTDSAITSIVRIFSDNSGQYVLVYDIT
jgi:hypothetical protein